MIAAVVLVGCGKIQEGRDLQKKAAEARAAVNFTDPFVEKVIRKAIFKLEGKLTEPDLAGIRALDLRGPRVTDAGLKDVAKLQNLRLLYLSGGRVLTDAGVTELKKALPNCEIRFSP